MRQPLLCLALPCLLTLGACSSGPAFTSTTGTEDAPDADDTAADNTTAAETGRSRDNGDAGLLADASFPDVSPGPIADASLPPLPPAFDQCATCMEQTCQPQLAACEADAYCEQMIACTITSDCLSSGASTCIKTCAANLGLTTKQTAAETKLLEAIAVSCSSCLAQCPKPDAGTVGKDGGQ